MPDTLRRIAVHEVDSAAEVDLVLPAGRPLGELLPAIVDTVLGHPAPPRRWHLTRLAGSTLDTSMSLRDNAVEDGDVLLLAPLPVTAPQLWHTESPAVVAALVDSGPSASGSRGILTAGVVCTALSATALLWSGVASPGGWQLWSAAALSATAATASAAITRPERHIDTFLHIAAIVFSVATALLAIPGASWQATFLLAAAAAFAMSVVLMRVATAHGLLPAVAAATGAAAFAAAVSVGATARTEVAGTVLSVVSLGALSAAPRLAAVLAGLTPSRPQPDGLRAADAHRILTALVAGWSVSSAAGAVMVAGAVIGADSPAVPAALLTACLGLVLVLRQRAHADARRQMCLAAAGSVAMLAASVTTVAVSPSAAFWVCTAAALACGEELRRAQRSTSANPAVRQTIQVSEYLALAAVIPMAFWVTGLYGLVRDLSLS